MAAYSHSKLTTFDQCKHKYKLQYIDKVKAEVPTTIEAFMGHLVHKTLEKLYKDAKHQKIVLLHELISFYNDLWNKEWNDDILIVKDYPAESFRKMGEQYIIAYYNHYHPFDEMTIIGLETQEQLLLPDGNTYHVRIDKLGCRGDTYFVCDYKTNATLKDKESADNDRQLAMYAIWVHQTFPDAKRMVLKWHMLAFDREVTSERTNEQLRAVQDEIMARIKQIEACTEFTTTVTKLCDYCVYKSMCPAWKHEKDLAAKAPEELKRDDGVKIVDEYAVLHEQAARIEEQLEKLKAKLIAFANAKGITAVCGSDKKANIKPYDFYSFPPKVERAYVDALIRDSKLWDQLSELDTHKISKALQERTLPPELSKELETFVKKKRLFRVSLVKR